MTDHIRLWGLKYGDEELLYRGVILLEKSLFQCDDTPDLWFCKNPNADLVIMNRGDFTGQVVYFWRTDRELTNCFRCLAMLKELESYE